MLDVQFSKSLRFEVYFSYSDSELIVNQINGNYKIKNDRMKQLHSSVMFELNQMDHWSVTHVRREKNTRADALRKNGMQKARESN
mgnify:CR=1 FL=1